MEVKPSNPPEKKKELTPKCAGVLAFLSAGKLKGTTCLLKPRE